MADPERRRMVSEFLAQISPDPFAEVRQRAERHREDHGCDLYPTEPDLMRLVVSIVRTCGARRMLDLGTGIGYSALWLADAGGEAAGVEAIDRDPGHVAIGEEVAAAAGLSDRIAFLEGEVSEVLVGLEGSYDLVHDDAWFAFEPPYLERAVELLRPGGVLTMANWFLLEDALTGEPRRDWTEFGGPDWADGVMRYARHLGEHPELEVAWTIAPAVAVAVKRR